MQLDAEKRQNSTIQRVYKPLFTSLCDHAAINTKQVSALFICSLIKHLNPFFNFIIFSGKLSKMQHKNPTEIQLSNMYFRVKSTHTTPYHTTINTKQIPPHFSLDQTFTTFKIIFSDELSKMQHKNHRIPNIQHVFWGGKLTPHRHQQLYIAEVISAQLGPIPPHTPGHLAWKSQTGP